MTRPKLRVIQGGNGTPPREPDPAGAPRPRPPVSRGTFGPFVWLFVVLLLGGLAMLWFGHPLLGAAAAFAGGAGMLAPPGRDTPPRARRMSQACIAAAIALAAADIVVSLLG